MTFSATATWFPPFLEAVLVATAWSDSPVFVVLDEMNLARVEYYFSDVLSAIETGVPLQLHSSAVPLEGSTGGEIRAEILLPANLFITGTINVDETTNPVSDKVLDRASLIDMSAVDLPGFLSKLTGASPDLEASAGICGPVLTRLHGLLAPHRLAFGYRLAEEFIRYHAFAVTAAGRSSDQVIGEAISQKILVRLRGTEAQRPLLETLLAELAPWPRSRRRHRAAGGRPGRNRLVPEHPVGAHACPVDHRRRHRTRLAGLAGGRAASGRRDPGRRTVSDRASRRRRSARRRPVP